MLKGKRKAANETIFLADYTKFNSFKIAKICFIEAINRIITDAKIIKDE